MKLFQQKNKESGQMKNYNVRFCESNTDTLRLMNTSIALLKYPLLFSNHTLKSVISKAGCKIAICNLFQQTAKMKSTILLIALLLTLHICSSNGISSLFRGNRKNFASGVRSYNDCTRSATFNLRSKR